MSGRKVSITVDDALYEEMDKRARMEGFERVPILIRYLITREMKESESSENRKAVTVLLDNYDEIASYVREKKFGKPEYFAAYAMEYYMNKNQLSAAQRARIERSVEV